MAKVKSEVSKIQNLTKEEMENLVSLTQDQIQSLKNLDEKAQKDFLSQEPKGIDQTIQSIPHVAEQMEKW